MATKTRKVKPVLTWDESKIVEDKIKDAIRNWKDLGYDEKPTDDDIRERMYIEDLDMEWDDFNNNLWEEHLVKIANSFETWFIEGTNMGWQNRLGHKFFQATNAVDFVRAIIPNTGQFTLRVYKIRGKGIKIVCSHHDSPCGETYIIKPASKKMNKEEGHV